MISGHPPSAPGAVCLRGLPPAPAAALPAPVALDAGCGLVVFAPGRRVRLRARPRVSYPPGAQSAPGNGITFRSEHVVWVRGGRVLWRSQRTFHPGHFRGVFTTISDATSSGRRLAYGVSRWSGKPAREHRLLFVTNGAGRERLLATKDFPLGWTGRGLVTARASARRVVLSVWGLDGRPVASPRTLTTMPGTWTWDWATSRLYAVRRGRIVRSDGVSVTRLARLAELGLERSSPIMLAPLGNGLIELTTPSRLVVFDASGRTRVDAPLPGGWRLSGSITVDRAGAVAFEAVLGTGYSSRHYRLYAALPGARPRLLDSYTAVPVCAPHGLALRGSAVLLTDGSGLARLYDARGARSPVDLAPAVRWLRARHRTGQPRLV
jgi:hypothetical protein